METASILVGQQRSILIKPELGLLEVKYKFIYFYNLFPFKPLTHMENPPGFVDPSKLKRRFPLINAEYNSIFVRPNAKQWPKELDWKKRVQKTVFKIIYDHYEEAGGTIF
jgi:hypothetical protein